MSRPLKPASRPLVDSGGSWLTSARLVARGELPRLLEEHRAYLKRIAEVEVPSFLTARFDASDVVQETLLRAYHNFDQFAGKTDAEFVAWMRGILLNQIVDAIRYHGRKMRDHARDQGLTKAAACEKSPTASDLFQQNEQREQLLQTLERMPADYREVIRLRQEENLAFADIGERMHRSPDAARMLWGRAVIMLSKLLQAQESV